MEGITIKYNTPILIILWVSERLLIYVFFEALVRVNFELGDIFRAVSFEFLINYKELSVIKNIFHFK